MLKNDTLSEYYIKDSIPDTKSINFEQCIIIGNTLTIIALTVMILSILVSFLFDQNFSLTTQVFAHISTIISAGVVKLGYVIRCVGAHGLGHKAY
jgi:uncharacterized membrane protein YqjE